tara:strand:+ start:1035 stop:2198 length:1164 start_codon:yes stop_codon:yes gene_type:complete
VRNKKKIAITFPQLHEFGGGEIFCEYVVNLLSKFYKIDLYFYKVNKINKKLRIKKNIKIIPIKSKWKLIDYLCSKYIGLAQLYLIIFLNTKKLDYKFLFSAAGEFYSNYYKVYQYIHHPFYSLNPCHYMALGVKKNDFIRIILRFFLSFFARIYFKFFILKKNQKNKRVSMVNSYWTRIRFKSIYNEKAVVVYPTFSIPKYLKGFQKKYEKRKNDFVILGRVSRDKDTIFGANFFINLSNKISELGKLHIIGPYDYTTRKIINSKFSKFKNKIIFHGYLSIKKRNKILKKSKFGLHFAKYEHFGRAILEMHKHGLIVFVHDSGGSKEIVIDDNQKYSSMQELDYNIRKLIALNNARYKIIKKYDQKFLKNFTDDKFRKEFKKVFLIK